jgi:hypothetical protein
MPATHSNSMRPVGGIHPYGAAWKFNDDPAEDYDFRIRLQQITPTKAYLVDRSGPTPVLRSSSWSRPLVVGQVWRKSSTDQFVMPCDGLLFWECDEYGRAYETSNVVAP